MCEAPARPLRVAPGWRTAVRSVGHKRTVEAATQRRMSEDASAMPSHPIAASSFVAITALPLLAIAAVAACAPPPAAPSTPSHPAAATAAAAPAAAPAAGPAASGPSAPAATPAAPAGPEPKTMQSYIRVSTPRVVLTHVRVIDGAGHPPAEDRNLLVERGKIAAIQPGADVAASPDTTVLDLRGYSVIPGLVGMHDHLFYIARPNFDEHWSSEPPIQVPEMMFSSPRLYLAAGVTTMRNT